MIAITGGNSVLGRMIISKLQTFISKNQLIISVRDINKAKDLIDSGFEVRQADFDDRAALKQAFTGISKLIFISGAAPTARRIQQHINIVESAKEMGVQYVLYTSFIDVAPNSSFAFSSIHAKTESSIKQSGLTYTLLRNNLYADFLARLIPDANDNISLPAGNGKVAFISREDIADFAVKVLLQSDLHQNKIYHLTGPKAYSWFDIAELMAKKNKTQISYVHCSPEKFANKLIHAGMPAWASQAITSMYLAVSNEKFGYATVSSDYENVVGHSAQTINKFLPYLG